MAYKEPFGIIDDARKQAQAQGFTLKLEASAVKLVGTEGTYTFLSFTDCIRFLNNKQ